MEARCQNGCFVQHIFEVRTRKERTGRNPRTNEEIQIAASSAPAFKAAKALKDAVSK